MTNMISTNRKWHLVKIAICAIFCTCVTFAHANSRLRVVVSTDIGGTDPDDFQSLVHLLLYADSIEIEGLISSPFGPGRKSDILTVIDKYEQDYASLRSSSKNYPSPNVLRTMTKQGETRVAPYRGFRNATQGSNWIIERARNDDPRPLYVLVWGGIEDLAQALHDAPDILPRLRVYWIGGPNKKWSPDAYQYLVEHHPALWIIESNATYRGWFLGGIQSGDWGNKTFVERHIQGHGALGDFFSKQLGGVIKMGDTPSVAWLFNSNPLEPTEGGWGGEYTRAWPRPYRLFERVTTNADVIEEFGIVELKLPVSRSEKNDAFATLHIENQSLAGYIDNGYVHFRFCPKAAREFKYKIESSYPRIDGVNGAIKAVAARTKVKPDVKRPNWWTDNPDPKFREGPHIGVKTVNKWRESFLRDFSSRMDRVSKGKVSAGD